MAQIELWYWKIRSDTTGKVGRSTCRMSEASALERDPGAVKIAGTLEVRDLPEQAHSTAFGRHAARQHALPLLTLSGRFVK